MSPPSKDTVLLLTTTSAVDKDHDANLHHETLRKTLAEISVTHIELNDALMNEADWDTVLSAILEHNRSVTL